MYFKKIFLTLILLAQLLVPNKPAYADNVVLDALATPAGIAAVGCVYGLTSGVSNFIWAFNWAKHANVTADMSATLQEWGGLVSSMEGFLLGAILPIIVFSYSKKHPAAAATPAP